jgi:hypothetical protein
MATTVANAAGFAFLGELATRTPTAKQQVAFGQLTKGSSVTRAARALPNRFIVVVQSKVPQRRPQLV